MFEFEEKVITSSDGDQHLSLIISGAVTVENIAKLKALLLAGFSQHDHIIIDVQQLSATDFTLVQLLCATNKYAQQKNKLFGIVQPGSEVLETTAKLLGFGRCKGCVAAINPDGCLWIADKL